MFLIKRSEFNSYILSNRGAVEPLVKELEVCVAPNEADRVHVATIATLATVGGLRGGHTPGRCSTQLMGLL
jgi:hypothetical protein